MKTPPLIPAWLLLATVAAILAAMCVSGCAMHDLQAHEERHCDGWVHTGEAPFYTWSRPRHSASKPWLYVRAIDPDSACRAIGATERGTMAACAQWHPDYCIIILPEGAP